MTNFSGPIPPATLIGAYYTLHHFHIHIFDTLTPLFNVNPPDTVFISNRVSVSPQIMAP